MELFNFYQMAASFASIFYENNLQRTVLVGAIVGTSIWVLFFLLQGIGIYTLAKRTGREKKWLAFFPFANIFYLGKIVGECHVFGQKMKRAGLYAMIAQIISTLLSVAYIFAEIYLISNFKPLVDEMNTIYWVGLKGFAGTVNTFYEVGGYFMSLFPLVTQILLLILMIGFFKKYSPRNFRLLAVITFIIPMMRFIFIFAFRNREPFDYEAYVQRQREIFISRQQQYYNGQNPYGNQNNPYGNPYNNSNNTPYGGQQPSQPDDPFDEFAENAPAQENGEDTRDGFFD